MGATEAGVDPVLVEGIRVAGFQILGLLGEGAMGQVYLAQDTALDRRVALKFIKRSVMQSGGLERFLEEARATASFNHPHIVTIHAIGEHEGRPYLALEYLDGESLRARLAAGPLPMRAALRYGRAVAEAVAEAHRRGLIHADLKPENIVIPSDGRLRVVDFGLAKLAGAPSNATSGTPAYMAPERWRNASPTGAIDIWAIGVVLHELITGGRPIADQALLHLMFGAEGHGIPALPDTPWAHLVRDCLALDPLARPSAGEVVRRLTALLESYAGAPDEEAAAAGAGSTAAQVQQRVTELAADEAHLARGLLRALVGPDGTRRRRLRGELLDAAPAGERTALGQLIDRLVDRRLVLATRDEERGDLALEVAHDALTSAWPQLGRWLGESDVRRSTPALASTPVLASTPATSDLSAAGALPSVTGLPFEGRHETLAALVRSGCAAIAAHTPTLVTVRGDAGIGKTRLAAAVQQTLAEVAPEARVLAFRGQDPPVGEVDETIRAILRRLVSPSGAVVPRRETRAQLQAQVGDAWPAVALILGWIGRDAPELQPLAQAPGALRIAAIEATAKLIRRAAEQAPLCILLDDAHLADATTLDAIELATLDRTGAAPLWICALVRPSFDVQRPSWGDRAGRGETIELDPLPDAAVQELCRTLLHPAENLPAQLVETIAARADGNAMLLGELCRALKSEGIIRQERSGAWILETDRLDAWPRTPRLTWLAERELRRLPPALARHAQLAALLGPRFAVADMLGVIRLLEAAPGGRKFPLDPQEALAQLERAQLVRVRERRGCEFRNAMLCEAMRAAIPEPLRSELHRAAFEHYRDLSNLPLERRRPRLAFHAAEAGLREPAAMVYEELATEYLYRHCYIEAESAFSRVLSLVDGARRRLAALHGRGLARYRTGRYEDAFADLHQARALAGELGDRRAQLMILLDEATVLDWLQNFRSSAELVEQAAVLARDDADPVVAARIEMGHARTLWRFKRRVEARASLLEVVRRAEAAGPGAYESLIVSLLMLGAVLCDLGEIQEARAVFDRILAMARAQGDRLHEVSALNNRRRIWYAEKDITRALDDLGALLEIGRALGLVLVELVGTYNLGELLYQAGDLDGAWPHVEHAVALADRRPDLLPRPLARLLETRLLAYEGRWQEAEALGTTVAELHRAAQTEGRSDSELLPNEKVLLDAVLLACAGGSAEAWAEVRACSGRRSQGQETLEVIELHALGALRAGDLQGARRAVEDALAIASKLPNIMESRLRQRLLEIEARQRS